MKKYVGWIENWNGVRIFRTTVMATDEDMACELVEEEYHRLYWGAKDIEVYAIEI